MFLKDPILQIALSISFTLFVRNMQIPMYLLATGAFIERITGFYMIANEFLTCIYYAIIAFPLFSAELSSTRASYMCIEITLVALVLNIFSNIMLTVKKCKNWIKARMDKAKNRVEPFDENQYNITTTVDEKNIFKIN